MFENPLFPKVRRKLPEPKRTPRLKPNVDEVTYLTRHLPLELHDRATIYSFWWDTTIEDVLNRAIQRGLEEFDNHSGVNWHWRPDGLEIKP